MCPYSPMFLVLAPALPVQTWGHLSNSSTISNIGGSLGRRPGLHAVVWGEALRHTHVAGPLTG